MKCVISTEESDPKVLVEKAKASAGLVGRDLATEVTIDVRYSWPEQTIQTPPIKGGHRLWNQIKPVAHF